MTTIPELGARLNVPVSDLIKLGEKQVMNPDSVLAKSLAASIAARLVTLKAASNDSVKKKRERSRVYLQHAVPLEYRYDITNAFPMFDIHYSCADIRSGAVALAVSVCISEYMLSKFNIKQGNVIAYGVGIKQLLTRNRHWVHLCVSGSSLRAQANFFREDRAVAAIANTMKSSGQRANLAKQYVTGAHCIHCTNATGCNVQAKVGVMMLAGVDTNFRQVAYFMRQHGTRLLYFAVPGSKEMEMGVEGKFPELDGYVFPSHGGERINLCFKNASTENMTHTYANYLELIARTSVVLDGVTYHKEFDSRVQGFLVYKVTRIDGVFKEAPPPYKSWIEPKYKDKYMVYIPELVNGGNVHSASNWTLRGVPIDRDIIDDVVDFAMRAQGVPDIAQRISRRMFTRTSNFTLINQVVENTSSVPVHLFDSLCLAIYCAVFMAKFNDGKTVATLAPFARTAAMMAEKSFMGVAKEFMAAIIGNVAQATSVVTDTLRRTYYEVVANETLPMPSFAVCPGYVEYTDTGSSNPRFKGWSNGEYGATSGFSPLLPSMCFDGTFVADDSVSVSSAGLTTADDYVIAMIATGEGYINENRQVAAAEHDSVITVAKSLLSSVHSVFTNVPSFDVDEEFQQTVMATPNSQVEVARQQPGLYARSQQKFLVKSDAGQVKDLTTRIANDTGRHVRVTVERHTQMQPMFVPQVPEVIPGSVSSDPVEYVRSAVLKIFPDSLSMVLEQAESDRNYSGWETIARAIRVKLDVSRISGVKPEAYYKPLLAGHVAPSVKDSFSTTLHSVVKRNLNTTVNNDPMDTEALWTRAWQAMCKVFYIADADKMLDRHPYIGPHEDAIHEWVSKLDEGKRDRLMAQPGGYTFTELFQGASATQLMVKKKLKPALDASYTTSVKYPQTIQYDPTGQSVAVFSPIIAEKVKLEQSLLRPNILVMQGKSVHDVNVFLNNFDWREDKRGVRRYIEIDYTMFDKSQGHVLAEMYLRALEKFKTLPEYVRFIRDAQHSRTVAAMKAGIKAWLIDQNMSGAAYTLDRNNTIGEMVIAELLVEIIHQIEFVIIMGDDILIAIRGDVNIAHWESELSRKYNLVLKAAVHEHGYICSMDVCHLPDGNTRVVSDVVKRAVSFMDQSMSEEDKFLERYISYCDNLQGVQDVHVQNYLAAALPKRMQSYLPGTSSDAIRMLVQAHAGMLPKYEGDMSGYKLWRSFYSDVKHLRTY